ncbi:ferritin-like domain-containing protein [Nonomuraea sp. 3-1Str]|uniref:ferritin-like domain-containing protein n=1 Tax=Nonomuraea sp. 3-1Str TaxID=2929801 RepID=UPI002861BD47|nr:ferritin-like domain-containing protein [Nonomuraea sp. 3-1Str]MDR8415206.1 ferritin-like domain-containing protein [Nonomuraea sp. 3-1Str]
MSGDAERLGKALAAEHAAVFAYGLISARTSGTLRSKATRAFDAHRARRDQLRAFVTARGGRPAEAEPSYSLPLVPSTPTDAVRLAVQVETGVTAAYLELVAADDPALRKYAALAMQEAVARSYAFRPAIGTAFPGMPAAAPPASPGPSPVSPPASPSAPTGG